MDKHKDNLLCFIIPYFGTLPNTFTLFLKTCAYNKGYNWIIFTDDNTSYIYPDNVKCIHVTFERMQQRIQSKFDFPIMISSPGKLCDFKPAYGYIFAEELKEYQYWGYCDIDEYFGDLGKYLTRDFLAKYDKLFLMGHMTIFKNSEWINRIFMDTGYYKKVFSNAGNLIFDEPNKSVNIHKLFNDREVQSCYEWFFFDADPYKSCFVGTFYDTGINKWLLQDNSNSVLLWDKGHIYVCYKLKSTGSIKWDEVLYAHIQKRNLQFIYGDSHKLTDRFLIMPNKVVVLDDAINDISRIVRKAILRCRIRGFFRIDEIREKKKIVKRIRQVWTFRFGRNR